MSTLIIFNHQPYDGSDVTWNGLRLAKILQSKGEDIVKMFKKENITV